MTSLAVEFPARDQVRLITTPIDGSPLKPLEALIVAETSVISSGTELARLRGIEAGATFPCLPGYGAVGRIADLGAGMDGFAIGQRVFFAGRHAARQRFTHGADHEWGWLFPVPDGLDPVDAAIGCMARIAVTAPQVTELQPGDTVAVFGLGIVGLIAAQLYRIRGARVIGVDPVASRCALARRLGIAETIDVAPAGQVAALRALTGGAGAAVTVDAAGHSAVVAACVAATATLGQVVLLGTPRAPHQADMTATMLVVHERGLTLRGAHMWRFPLRAARGVPFSVEQAFAAVYALIADGRLRLRELVSHVIAPGRAPEAYAGLAERPAEWTGVVIDWR